MLAFVRFILCITTVSGIIIVEGRQMKPENQNPQSDPLEDFLPLNKPRILLARDQAAFTAARMGPISVRNR